MFRARQEKILQGKPLRYRPTDVLFVGLYCLHRDLSFNSILEPKIQPSSTISATHSIEVSVSEKEIPTPIINRDYPVIGYRFTRADGKKINYFSTVRDVEEEGDGFEKIGIGCPSLSTWLEGLIELERKQEISLREDIIIVPLVQVQNRAHYNTLLLHYEISTNKDPDNEEKEDDGYKNKGRLNIYLIEPRKDNRSGFTRRMYPVEHIQEEIVSSLSRILPREQIHFYNPQLDLQAMLDDKTCGAHHLNFTEIMIQLRDVELNKPERFANYLRTAQLIRREDDNKKIKCVGHGLKDVGYVEESDVGESKSKGKEKDSLTDDEDGDWCGIERSNDAPKTIYSHQYNEGLNADLRVEPQLEKMLGEAIEEIEEYSKLKQGLSTSGRHTRHGTAKLLTNFLQDINKDQSELHAGIHKVSLILYLFHSTIDDKKSKLGDHIAKALAKLLDCEVEYHAYSKDAKKLDAIFEQRLKLNKCSIGTHPESGTSAIVNKIKDLIKQINHSGFGLTKKKDKVKLFQEALMLLQQITFVNRYHQSASRIPYNNKYLN